MEVSKQSSEGTVGVTYYTDPGCSWAWGTEPKVRKLVWEFGERLAWRYVMGGLVGDRAVYAPALSGEGDDRKFPRSRRRRRCRAPCGHSSSRYGKSMTLTPGRLLRWGLRRRMSLLCRSLSHQ